MTMMIRRRGLLAFASASAAYVAGGGGARAQSTSPIPLIVARRSIEVNGKAAAVFALHQPDGKLGVSLGPDERFIVNLTNDAGERTIIHWHGQTPPVRQDGVTQTGLESLIVPGASQGYDYLPRAGTHWMHSHHGLQEQSLMAAPLIIRTAEDLRADVQEVVVMLHDFTFRNPDEILAELTKGAGMAMGSGANANAAMPGMNMGDQSLSGVNGDGHAAMQGGSTPSRPSTGMTGMAMDLNDIDFDAYLANDRTLADPLVVRTERNGRLRLRLINGASSTAFWVVSG